MSKITITIETPDRNPTDEVFDLAKEQEFGMGLEHIITLLRDWRNGLTDPKAALEEIESAVSRMPREWIKTRVE